MNLDDIIVIAVNKRIAGKSVCLLVDKLEDLRGSTKVVLTQYGVHFACAADKDFLRLAAVDYDEIYCYNVQIDCYATRFMHSRLRSKKPDHAKAMHFYYGNGQTALPGLTVVE